MELDPVRSRFPDLLEQGLAMVRERAERGGLAVTLDVAPEVGVVWADELKLKQVVINLLTNAVKFTPDGGAVTVTARVEDDEVQVTVRDTGIGISAHEQRADLRGVPARRPARAVDRRGHRAGPDAVAPDRRAPRRAAVAGEPARRGQHVRFRAARRPRRRAGDRRARGQAATRGGRTSCW